MVELLALSETTLAAKKSDWLNEQLAPGIAHLRYLRAKKANEKTAAALQLKKLVELQGHRSSHVPRGGLEGMWPDLHEYPLQDFLKDEGVAAPEKKRR